MFSLPSLLAVTALATQANAATHRIDVGMDGFTFTPDSLTAAKGDELEFHYHPLNHSVVMGDFNNPCKPATSGGFFSGFMPTSSGENANVFTVTINDTEPIVFYCSQNTLTHCKSGMSGVVNPANSSQLTDYKNAAKNADTAVSPASVFGGSVTTASTTSGSSSSPSSTPTSGGGSGNPYGGGSGGGNNNAAAGLTASAITILGAAAVALFMA